MLAPWKQSSDNPRQSIKKQRHYFANKGPYGQSYGFSGSHVWMWDLDCKEDWVLKIWCFWTVVLRRLLRVPWTARRSNQSILKKISPEYSLEGLMLKPKLQYFGHLMGRTDSLEKTLMLGKIEGRRRRGQQRIRWLDGITDSIYEFEQTLEDGEGQGSLVCCSLWGCKQLAMIEWLYKNIFLGSLGNLALLVSQWLVKNLF